MTQSQFQIKTGRDNGLSTLYCSCTFACLRKVLKSFSGLGYPESEIHAVWL